MRDGTTRAILRTMEASLVPKNHEMRSRSYDFVGNIYEQNPGKFQSLSKAQRFFIQFSSWVFDHIK